MLNPPLLLVGSRTLMVTRRNSGGYVNGRYVEGTTTKVLINKANVQPVLRATDTMMLPEADRSKATLKVYTSGEPLRQLREGDDGWLADQFEWDGDLYEVMKVIPYQMGVLDHYKAICARVELT